MSKRKLKTLKKARLKTVKKTEKRKIELTPATKTVLWSMISGTDTPSDISENLNMEEDKVEGEINKLLDQGLIFEKGRFIKGYDLTTQAYEILGTPAIRLESYLSSQMIKSGGFTKLTVIAKNIGNVPITNALIKIVSPTLLRIARHGAEYRHNGESSIINFALTHLNPEETQILEFNLQGSLASGTVSSNYKILVNATIDDLIADKKELGIVVET